jgi:O-antigen/teichoic acid export membrane protein
MNTNNGIENIGKTDVIWNYVATFFQIGSGIILLPFILKKLSAETVGLWVIFQTIMSLVVLFDFGFKPAFARNVSYVFSGAKKLKKKGVPELINTDKTVDYGLLKSLIATMRWFYSWLAAIVFTILIVAGSLYMYYVLRSYTGNTTDALVAWIILILIASYNLYTLYYDSLLLGKGYVKRSKQIMIIGQVVYLGIAIGLIYAGGGLIAIVSAQFTSIAIKRFLSYKVFFTKELKTELRTASSEDKKEVVKIVLPNALKVGLTHLGGFLVNKSAVFIGAIYLTLTEIADYGITIQVVGILAGLAGVFYQSFIPKLAQYRVENNMELLKRVYIQSVSMLFFVFVTGGVVFLLLGQWALEFIGSDTRFLVNLMIIIILVINLLEKNHALAAGFLLAKNEVPFFKASLISGAATVFLLWITLDQLHWGLWGMILAPGIVQACYQNWKWPVVLINELRQI